MTSKHFMAVVAVTALLSSACTTGAVSTSKPQAGASKAESTLRVGVTSDVTSFDPAKGAAAIDYVLSRLQFATLVGVDDGGKAVPALAEKWTQTPTEAVFTLRGDATCSDGKPLTATAVADSLKRYADPKLGSPSSAITFGPLGKPAFSADDAARTVAIKLASPWSDLVNNLSATGTGIVCAPGLADLSGLAQGAVKGAGSGPYVVTQAQRGSSYTLALRQEFTAFPAYAKQPAGVAATTLALNVVKNESTLANQLLTGQLDFATFTGTDAARFTDPAKFTMLAVPTIRNFLVFNERPGHPGADPKVRKAVAQAVDAGAFNKVFGGAGKLMASYVDPDAACVNTDTSLLTKPDPAAAAAVLKGLKIKVVGTNGVGGGAGNEYVQAALKQAGAEVALTNTDNATWATQVLGNQGEWDLTPMAFISGSLTSGASYLMGPEPPAGRNFGGHQNAEFAKHFGVATATVDQPARCAAWEQAQAAALKENMIVPLATINVHYVARAGISAPMPNGALDVSWVRIAG